MSHFERGVEELLSATQQYYFQLDKERCEGAHREELVKLSGAIQGLVAALAKRLNDVWRLDCEELTVYLFQNLGSSPLVTAVLYGSVAGIVSISHTTFKEPEREEFTLQISKEGTFVWRSGAGDLLDSTALAEHCCAKALFMAEGLVRSEIQYHEQKLREQLKKKREAQVATQEQGSA